MIHARTDMGICPHKSTGIFPLTVESPARDNVGMNNQREIFAERLQERIEDLGTNNRAVSVAVTGKPDLVRDTLRRRSIPNAAIMNRLAEVLETTSDWLLGLVDTHEPVRSEVSIGPPPKHLQDARDRWTGAPDDRIPVLGTAYCDDLVLEDEGDTVEIERVMLETDHVVQMVARPPALWNAPDAYAIYHHGSSMEPRYFQGELSIVNPRRPPGPGDFVIVQLNDGESDDIVTVLAKQLIRVAANHVELRQFNPDLTFRIPRTRVARLHRICETAELYG